MVGATYAYPISLQIIPLVLHTVFTSLVKVALLVRNERHALENGFILLCNLWHLRVSE